MSDNIKYEYAHEKGYGAMINEIYFHTEDKYGGTLYSPNKEYGTGFIYQINPCPGVFLSVGNWLPYEPIERRYEMDKMFLEIYLVESGNITLIQNGKKSYSVSKGINLYVNTTKKGRVCFQENIPIKYVGILLFEDFIKDHIEMDFSKDDFDFNLISKLDNSHYNTLEINMLFLQVKQKLLSYENSYLFYKSKIGELLSLIMINFNNEMKQKKNLTSYISDSDLKYIKLVKDKIDKNILNPPDMDSLCRIAMMGKTKLRETFKKVTKMTLGEYIRCCKMKYALILLNNKDYSIADIAHTLNYSNTSKFSGAFKKLYGQNPEAYRKNILKILN